MQIQDYKRLSAPFLDAECAYEFYYECARVKIYARASIIIILWPV